MKSKTFEKMSRSKIVSYCSLQAKNSLKKSHHNENGSLVDLTGPADIIFSP